MNVAGFSGEDERQRFYGDDDRPRSRPGIDRPQPTEGVELGLAWRVADDPAAVYALRWINETREIYVTRHYQPLPLMVDGLEPAVDGEEPAALSAPWPPPVTNIELGTELLGWAEDLEVLEEALEGWEEQMHEEDSLRWVRLRLADAATETQRQRGPGAAGWWPGAPPFR